MELPTVVLGVIGADCHVTGVRVLEHALRKGGFQVVSLGVMNSQEDFILAAIETKAKAILVSSLYGHADLDCRGLREKCTEAGLSEVKLYLGGNLSVAENEDWPVIEDHFHKMGFDRVYPPETRPSVAISDLRQDLGVRVGA